MFIDYHIWKAVDLDLVCKISLLYVLSLIQWLKVYHCFCIESKWRCETEYVYLKYIALLEATKRANFKGTSGQIADGFASGRYKCFFTKLWLFLIWKWILESCILKLIKFGYVVWCQVGYTNISCMGDIGQVSSAVNCRGVSKRKPICSDCEVNRRGWSYASRRLVPCSVSS